MNLKLRDLFSRKEAALYIGRTEMTLRVYHEDGSLVGIPVGGVGGKRTASFVYVRRQLEAYKEKGKGVPTAEEVAQIMDIEQAASFLGMSVDALNRQASDKKRVPFRTVGGVRIFLRRDVERFKKRRDRILAEIEAPRVDVVDGRVADFDVATAIADYRQAHGLSQAALAAQVDSSLSQLRQIISKIERRETVRVREEVYGRLVAIVRGE